MDNFRLTYDKVAYGLSILFHIGLLMLFLKISVFIEVEPPEFYELNLGAVSQERVEQILSEARRAEMNRRIQQEGATPDQRVNVPERKMIEIDEPTISVPREDRLESHDIVVNAEKQAIDVGRPNIDVPVLDDNAFTMERKEMYEGSKISVGEEPGAGIETQTIGMDVADFTIEGEIKGREILSNPLPKYPEGLNQNATIRISFTVLPDGRVSPTGMIPVKKAHTVA